MAVGQSPDLRGLQAEDAAPGVGAFAITPSDSVDFTKVPRAIYVGGTGNIVFVNLDNTTVTFTAVPVGTIIPCVCRRINATLTTATALVGLL